jgi:hypothetical protein
MGILKRLFSSAPDSKKTDKGLEAADLAATMLMTQLDFGDALPGGANRQRLGEPFARGYMFGFIDAMVQRVGATDQTQALALITLAHTRMLGVELGSKFVGEALADQAPDSIFTKGRAAGGADLMRWFGNTDVPPFALSDYLNGREAGH